MKKFFISALIFNSVLYAGFIDGVKTNVKSKININNYSSYLNISLNDSGDSILSNPLLGSYLSSNSWSDGLMSLCYDYEGYDYEEENSDVTMSLCDILKNSSVDPCALLPNKIGGYVKKTNKIDMPLYDWCKKISGDNNNISLKKVLNNMGESGKKKDKTKDIVFNDNKNGVKKKIQDKISSMSDLFNKRIKNTDTKDQKQIKELIAKGKSNVAIERVKAIAERVNKDSLTQNDTKALENPKIIFKNYKEYIDDVEASAKYTYDVERNLLNFNSFLELANDRFLSMNVEHKLFSDKLSWFKNEVEKRRKDLQFLANKKAEKEITYKLSEKLGYYYAFFDEDLILEDKDSGNMTRDTKKILINSKIRKQEYFEKSIKVKWALWADKIADELYVKGKKLAIASEVFPEDLALQNIEELIK